MSLYYQIIQPWPRSRLIKKEKRRNQKQKQKNVCLLLFQQSFSQESCLLNQQKKVWDYMKKEYGGHERIYGMQSLNLIWEFELQKIKESEIIKEYSDRLLGIVNRVRLLRTTFTYSRIIEKLMVIVPKKYEALITTLENTKDLLKITLAELLNSLQAQEQRRLMR